MKHIVRLLWIVCIFNAGSVAAIETGLRPNATEMPRLPQYCQVKFNSPPGSPEWNAWRDRIGQNYIDIHHYCAALNYMNRYWGARTSSDRKFYLERAMSNFDYMAKAEKPDFALRAELYSNRGDVFKLMRRPGEAMKDFNHALSIDPGFVKAYLQLADLNVAVKSPTRALDVVTEGLRHVPDSAALQRRYLELGGKKPFPEPLVANAGEPSSPQAAVKEPAVEAASEPASAAASTSSEPVSETNAKPSIGTPKNPYCRFCPPE